MKDFNWEEFKKGNIRVSAPTEKIAMDFFVKANAQDIYWANGNNVVMAPKWHESIYYRYDDDGLVHGAVQWNRGSHNKEITWKIKEEKQMAVKVNKRIKLDELEEGKEYCAYDGDGRFQPNIKYRRLEDRLQFTTMIAGQATWLESGLGIFEMLTWEFEEIQPKKETGWFDKENKEHTNGGFYYMDEDGDIDSTDWGNWGCDERAFDNANCFTTVAKAEEERDKDTLRRLMQRFADENNEGCIDWDNSYNYKYSIGYNHDTDKHVVHGESVCQTEGVVYFSSPIIAERCMDDVVIPFKEKVDK